MENLDMQSVLKAGAIAAGVAIALNVLSVIPFIGGIFTFLLICGGIFIPIAGGMMYGYFAEGKEDTQTAAIGGALAGGVSGIILAVLGSILGGIIGSVEGSILAGGIFGSICLGILGFGFGALGGAIWPSIQDRFSGAS
ncbi:MAG: hypothetical protein AAF902_16375 [Chloroflexota bacterium]